VVPNHSHRGACRASRVRGEEIYPKHVNDKSQAAVKKGLEYLAKSQNQDGYWTNGRDGTAYPVTMASIAGMAFLAKRQHAHARASRR